MNRNLLVFLALAVVTAVPFLLRPKDDQLAKADRTLVVITPHNEAIRFEFARAFNDYFKARHGQSVRIGWRTPGGTSEIARFIASQYQAAFEFYWTKHLGKKWTSQVLGAFDNRAIIPASDPALDNPEQAARRAFLKSDVSSGMDLFFGGGSFDFELQAAAGRLVDSGVLQRHPEWFGEGGIPRELGGEAFRDAIGRWVSACLGAFGICFNHDAARNLGLDPAAAAQTPQADGPFEFHGFTRWTDLAIPRLNRQIAVADPTKSGSAAKAFEMILQQQMREAVAQSAASGEAAALAAGWENGLRLIVRIAANARYFTDSGSKVPLDVAIGDAAAGMSIDFYGRFQSESVRDPLTGFSRMEYRTPAAGSSTGGDPIGMLRGAPDPELAREFIDFVLSLEGQKLWNFRPGTPGGPVRFALRRPPVRPELYAPEFRQFRSDPDMMPYKDAQHSEYHPEWTAPLFQVISFSVRVACLDPHDELREAWEALIKTGFPSDALAVFEDVSPLSYAEANGRLRDALRSPDRLAEVRLAKELSDHFRANYLEVTRLCQGHSAPRQNLSSGNKAMPGTR